MKHCSYGQTHESSEVCVFNTDLFGECSRSNSYGYKANQPCIFLKLNKIFGWNPEVIDAPQKDMPEDLQKVINATSVEEVDIFPCKMFTFLIPDLPFAAQTNLGELPRTLEQGQGAFPEHQVLPQPGIPGLLLPVSEPARLSESPGRRAVQFAAQGPNAGR